MSAPIFNAEREDKQPEKVDRPEGLAEQLSFKSRFVLVFGEINHTVARTVCERLIALSQQSDAPIRMLISSPGGHVESGDAIHDVLRFINAPVITIGTGFARIPLYCTPSSRCSASLFRSPTFRQFLVGPCSSACGSVASL